MTYSECVFVALVIQRAKRMHHITVYCHVAPPAVPYIPTLSRKRQDFHNLESNSGLPYCVSGPQPTAASLGPVYIVTFEM